MKTMQNSNSPNDQASTPCNGDCPSLPGGQRSGTPGGAASCSLRSAESHDKNSWNEIPRAQTQNLDVHDNQTDGSPLPFLAAPKSDEGGIKEEGRPALHSASDEGGGEGSVS